MLRKLKDLEHYKIVATDGDVGKVVGFYFDDERWVVRYLVVQSDGPMILNGRQTLLSPVSFRKVDYVARRFDVALTMEQIRTSPAIDLHKPVSRQHERSHADHFLYPVYYWDDAGGSSADLGLLLRDDAESRRVDASTADDVHLRSIDEVCGYHVEASDGAIGRVEDFIVDDETWEVRYIVVNTNNWWLGKHVLVAPQWTRQVSWAAKKVRLDLSRDVIKKSPEWSPSFAIEREYESRLHSYYSRP